MARMETEIDGMGGSYSLGMGGWVEGDVHQSQGRPTLPLRALRELSAGG